MLKLLTVNDETQAILIKGQLEQEGVKVIMTTSNESYLPGIIGVHNGVVPYDIFVPESQLEKSREIIGQDQLSLKEKVDKELRHDEDTQYP